MIDFIAEKIKDKSILILGFGREGESTFRFLEKHFNGQNVAIADASPKVCSRLPGSNIKFITGPDYLHAINDYDVVIKTPGISLNHVDFNFDKGKITSQTDLFLQFYSDQIIGITGTKGKSTTTSLIYHIIKLFTDDAVMVGNIGVPPFDRVDEIQPSTRIVFELSSHQLEYICRAPHMAILLNIFQEHLDHYKNFDDYKLAKLNIATFQNAFDCFIYNGDDKTLMSLLSKADIISRQYKFSLNQEVDKGCFVSENTIYYYEGIKQMPVYNLCQKRNLQGEHNVGNIMAAICACKLSGINEDIIVEGINSFKGLEHRIEYVGKYNNISYYNDSIATIPEATIEALKTLHPVETLILGGFDRGIDYSVLSEFIASSQVSNIIFMGKAGERMMELVKQNNPHKIKLVFVHSLHEAVKHAAQFTPTGGKCLLSPAAASYDCFKNFEARGGEYKRIVKTL